MAKSAEFTKFKKAVLNRKKTDRQVEKIFLNLKIENETESREVIKLLRKHRPEAFNWLYARYVLMPPFGVFMG